MDETMDLLDVLLDGVTEPRLKLISEDEARALMVLLGLLEDTEQPEDVHRATGDQPLLAGEVHEGGCGFS